MEKVDLHNYQRQYERQVELAKEDPEISEENKKWICKFADYMLSDGISYGKVGRYVGDLRKLAKMLPKPFQDANKDDLRSSLLNQLEDLGYNTEDLEKENIEIEYRNF